MSHDDERIKALSDIDLEIEAQQISHIVQPKHPILLELKRRKKAKEDYNQKTQTAIKNMTAIILVLTIISVALAFILLFK